MTRLRYLDSTVRSIVKTALGAVAVVVLMAGAACIADVAGSANPRYVIEGGAVYDKKTNLTWARCSVGQEWKAAAGCTGVPERFTFAKAQSLGTDGWRVPSEGELSTLVDWGRRADFKRPAIDEVAFPAIDKVYPWYRTSTPESELTGRVVGFMDGNPGSASLLGAYPVRLVRGEFKPFADVTAVANPRYVITGAFVYDRQTDLTWARCSNGQQWQEYVGCVGHPYRFSFDTAQDLVRRLKKGPLLDLSLDSKPGWRLPSSDELRSLIVDVRATGLTPPTIDVVAFPGMEEPRLIYWSDTEADAKRGRAVDFADGQVSENPRRDQYPLRMVRNGR